MFWTYFLYFIIYSFIGWSIEVIDKFFEFKRFINRGFLIGPICPVYGYGVLAILLVTGDNTSDPLAVFLKSILICSVLEYFTSYFMEKIFKARWWDYSKNKFNINGRICLETMLPFGILGSLVVYFIHPFIKGILSNFSNGLLITISIVLFVIYMIDNIISFNVMNKIKKEIKKQREDSTEIIRKKVLEFIDANSILYRHIKNAFPKFKIYDWVKDKIIK
jgi:uncharacterized membrane protein